MKPSLGLASFSLFLLLFVSGTTASASLPAFPGAEGSGSLAVGGRGGVLCEVTNLNDSGPGSLRACVQLTGPRTVVFRVGGTIDLRTNLHIGNPYITIAGQTAPGGGIQLRGSPDGMTSSAKSLITIGTHNVVIRYLRVRRGSLGDAGAGGLISILSGHDLIFDHLSLFWTEDENFSVWGWSAGSAPRNISLQNSLLAEALAAHPTNLITGAGASSVALAMTDIDFHNNLLANTSHRNPLLKHASGRWINNIVYNWSYYATQLGSGIYADVIGNLYKQGPAAKSSGTRAEFLVITDAWNDSRYIKRDASIYVSGNRGPWGLSPDSDNWPNVKAVPHENQSISGDPPAHWRRTAPLSPVGVPITVRSVNNLESHILPVVGAARRLDCYGNWLANRDSVDARIVEEYQKNLGSTTVAHQNDVGGFPRIETGTRCLDSSGDGIPDLWATTNGLDPSDSSLGRRLHSSGYTYLELYLSGTQLTGAEAPVAPAAAPSGVRVE